jgi:hypothetical protein
VRFHFQVTALLALLAVGETVPTNLVGVANRDSDDVIDGSYSVPGAVGEPQASKPAVTRTTRLKLNILGFEFLSVRPDCCPTRSSTVSLPNMS